MDVTATDVERAEQARAELVGSWWTWDGGPRDRVEVMGVNRAPLDTWGWFLRVRAFVSFGAIPTEFVYADGYWVSSSTSMRPAHDFTNPYLRRGRDGEIPCARCLVTDAAAPCHASAREAARFFAEKSRSADMRAYDYVRSRLGPANFSASPVEPYSGTLNGLGALACSTFWRR